MFLLLKKFKAAGNFIAFSTGYRNSDRYWMWHIKTNFKYGQWFANILTPIFYITKNNAEFAVALCFGKWYAELKYHW